MEKQEIWDSIVVKINKTCDKLSMPIDEGIKETVIVLQVLGFNTTQSCEGHDGRGLPYPWIMIECGNDSPYKDIQIAEYLEEFYSTYKPLKWARLSLNHFKGGFRLQSYIGRTAEKFKQSNLEEYEIVRKNCSKEMREFTIFLKEKFLNQ